MSIHRVAVIQDTPIPNDAHATIDLIADLTAKAKEQGAELALFPEGFVGGYLRGASFSAFVGGRAPEGRAQLLHYAKNAIEVPGSATKKMGAIAQKHEMYLVVGVIENGGGTLYCSVLFFDKEGALLGKHRKLMPTGMERLIWGYGDGSTLPVFSTDIGNIGAVICWENYMPMMRMAMYGQGVQIYCAPTADDKECWVASMRHIALEGRCFVLSSCQVMQGKDFPNELFENRYHPEHDTQLIHGGSCIINPDGKVIAGPIYDEKTILIADISLDLVRQGRMDFDVVGHYSRPDVFSLQVDTREKKPVVYSDDSSDF